MTVYATFVYFRKMLHLNFWMWHIHASLQTSWVHWCVAYFDLGAQEPHGFQLFQALLPALLMESSTSGVAQLEQMRQEALRYWHEVQWFSDQPVNSCEFRLKQLEITRKRRKRQFLKTCHHRSSHPCREKMRQNIGSPKLPRTVSQE